MHLRIQNGEWTIKSVALLCFTYQPSAADLLRAAPGTSAKFQGERVRTRKMEFQSHGLTGQARSNPARAYTAPYSAARPHGSVPSPCSYA